MTHELKILPIYFEAVKSGIKPFEVRRKDRNFSVGDTLVLREFEPQKGYSGAEIKKGISYILDDSDYCKDGFVILELNANGE